MIQDIIGQESNQQIELTIQNNQQLDNFYLVQQKRKTISANITFLFITNCNIGGLKFNENWVKLKTLSLEDNNNLYTLEPLNQIYAPILSKLLLFNNKIVSIKTLRRFNFLPSLTQISLSMNPLKQHFNILAQCDLGSLRQLRLYSLGQNKSQSICMCAKMNCFFIKQLGIQQVFQQSKIKIKLFSQLLRYAR